MTDSKRDLIVGCVLVLVSVIWSAIVYQTIPPGEGEGDVGPRAFPLVLGLALGVFALAMVLRQFRSASTILEDDPVQREPVSLAAPLMTFAHIAGYGFLMPRIGFVLATFVIVTSVMLVCVRERSPLRIAMASFGVTFGCWLLFGKVLGVYLASGSWINLG